MEDPDAPLMSETCSASASSVVAPAPLELGNVKNCNKAYPQGPRSNQEDDQLRRVLLAMQTNVDKVLAHEARIPQQRFSGLNEEQRPRRPPRWLRKRVLSATFLIVALLTFVFGSLALTNWQPDFDSRGNWTRITEDEEAISILDKLAN